MGRKKMVMQEEFNMNEMVEPVVNSPATAGETRPLPDSPEWSDYVLTQLETNEKDDLGNPTADGLRRMVLKNLGPILSEHINIVGTPCDDNLQRTTAVATLQFIDKNVYDVNENWVTRSVSGAADAFPGNIRGNPYNLFSTANAETRAYGRAYKRALGLRKVVTSEELVESTVEKTISEGTATSTQINCIDAACKRLDLNVGKMMKLGKVKFVDIHDVPRTKVSEWLGHLDNYERREGDEDVVRALDGIKGYQNGWRGETFGQYNSE